MVFILPAPNVEATLTNYTFFVMVTVNSVTVCKRVINSVSCVVGRTGGAVWSSQPRGFVLKLQGESFSGLGGVSHG